MMRTFARVASQLVVVLVPTLFSSASAQSRFSLAEAQSLERSQDWNRVLQYGKAWTQAEPNNSNAWGVVAVAYMIGMNRADLALEPTERGVSLAPKEPGAWTALGWMNRQLRRYPEATTAFKRAVELAPRNGNFWNNLAAAYADQRNYTMTLQTLEQEAQTAGPSLSADLWYNLGNGLSTVAASTRVGASSGKSSDQVLREAIAAYNQCLRMNPRYAGAWNNLGIAEQALGATQNALNDYQCAASLGDANGRSNIVELQRQIAEAQAQAARNAAFVDNTPAWVKAQNMRRERWNSDYYLRNFTPRPD